MLQYETQLWDKKALYVAGIDEVGRGCLFGDVVAAAVVLPPYSTLEGIDDSKKLSVKKREALYEVIMQQASGVGIARVDAATIDRINIKQAARLAMKQAVEHLQRRIQVSPEHLLIDAERIDCDIPQTAIIKGDAVSQSIAAASIIAKVTRDRLCLEWDKLYPQYGISIHKGYATRQHREKIVEYGPSPMHRRSFLKKLLHAEEQLQLELEISDKGLR